jgi:hypothetical protein
MLPLSPKYTSVYKILVAGIFVLPTFLAQTYSEVSFGWLDIAIRMSVFTRSLAVPETDPTEPEAVNSDG